ncbi:hypothetical protein HYH02_008138 [Chlamydomonas schloesseri]|uniref:GST N-terminal domain-containing protein n=1 Tax=Chlamydomonas schloesseri TaxID=2026947 RepID=A0A835WG60_9CHLO|nr:hypothetical protein HYH02_008138 [Chlamydomonas schloesseri]|eukprot:KAG2446984.1 hypothetical protein HYH02_008138 [Chlamydomonas schloesseri]
MSTSHLASPHPGSKPASEHAAPRVKSLELYDDPHSEYSAKVKVALFAKGLAWAPLPLPCGTTRSPEFRAVNPLGKIPALRVTFEDGRSELLIESEVILEFLEDAFPDAPRLLPADPLARSKARLVSRYHDLYLEPALRRLYPQVAPSVRDERLVQEAVAGFKERMAELAALLPPVAADDGADGSSTSSSPGSSSSAFALGQLQPGGGLGLGDCAYPALLLYAELILPLLDLEPAAGAGAGAGAGPGKNPLTMGSGGEGHQLEALLGSEGTGRLEGGRGMGAVYRAHPRLWAWRQALWGHPAVQAVFAELQPAAEEWVAMKLQQ